jgi:hypothetical protein
MILVQGEDFLVGHQGALLVFLATALGVKAEPLPSRLLLGMEAGPLAHSGPTRAHFYAHRKSETQIADVPQAPD